MPVASGVWRVVRVPEAAWEDLRQLHREREDLLTERTRHRNRLSSKLVAQGIRLPIGKDFWARLEAVMLFDGKWTAGAPQSRLDPGMGTSAMGVSCVKTPA